MAESSFGIGILGAASIAKKNARAIAKCRNGTGDRTGPMQQRPQLCALLMSIMKLYDRTRLQMYNLQASSEHIVNCVSLLLQSMHIP